MFETVVPESFAKKSKRLVYETLPLSIAIHVLAIGGIFIAHIWQVIFPVDAPRLMVSYNLTEIPPPPPPPPPPAPPKAQATPVQPVQHVEPKEIVAPTVIPDAIPIVEETPRVVAEVQGVPGGVEGGIEGGVVGGAVGGVVGGDVGGVDGGVIGGIVGNPLPTDRVIIERDKPLPMFPMSQTYPAYPEQARLRRIEDELVVRYVIGKNGKIKDVTVIQNAKNKVFDEAAVKAIKYWRFKPMIKNGEAVEVQHELTVFFRLDAGRGGST